MIIGSWDQDIAFRADKLFIPHQMVAAAITKTRKEKTYKIVPQIIKVTHAAS